MTTDAAAANAESMSAEGMKLIRSFVAVALPPELQSRVFETTKELATLLPSRDLRWSRKIENLHVTIKFLGPTSEERLTALGAALDRELVKLPRFRLQLHRMGAFPSARHASVIWAGTDDVDGGLAAVAATVETIAEDLGFARERRPMTGHVTVGRAKGGGVDARAALDAFVGREFGGLTVEEIHIYESRLGGGPDNAGSTYILRHKAALAPN
jgi:RNA 2',3'-cyclic 3'-phosphodiesterase